MLLPVEGNKGLFRDKDSSAILNCSDSDHQRYLELKNRKIQDIDKMNEMSEKINEIEQLKSDMNEMKDMMKLILLKLDSTS